MILSFTTLHLDFGVERFVSSRSRQYSVWEESGPEVERVGGGSRRLTGEEGNSTIMRESRLVEKMTDRGLVLERRSKVEV